MHALRTGAAKLPERHQTAFNAVWWRTSDQTASRAGLGWFTQVSAPDRSWTADVLGPSLVAAVGLGLSCVSVAIVAVAGVTPEEAGLASALINTSQQVGGALGLATLASIANTTTGDAFAFGVTDTTLALTEGFQGVCLVGACFALVGAVLAAVLISSPDSAEHAEAARRGEAPPPGLRHARDRGQRTPHEGRRPRDDEAQAAHGRRLRYALDAMPGWAAAARLAGRLPCSRRRPRGVARQQLMAAGARAAASLRSGPPTGGCGGNPPHLVA